ncbi:MAG: alpha/beta hydrolase [Gammaproteobacteria bacterium]|nr:alpha/beta hydrolase [Gammaproteobacteria bacterium]
MAVKLHHVCFENTGAPAIVLLHGLLGSSRNWMTIAKELHADYAVHLLDMRNHGQSPHADSMRWSELVADLKAYLVAENIDRIHLVGHSLGGKVAMRFACEYPDLVDRLVIVDIAAKAYPPYNDAEFRAMLSIDVGELSSRKQAEELLEPLVPEWAMRQFLLTNLVRNQELGSYRWQINLQSLHASLPHLREDPLLEEHRFENPVLLLRAGKSNFIEDTDIEAMQSKFPRLEEVTIPGAGHNVHVDDRRAFMAALQGWM